MVPYKKKSPKRSSSSKKKTPDNKIRYISAKAGIVAASIAAIAGLGIKGLMKKSSFAPRRSSEITMEPVNEFKHIEFYKALESDKDYKAIQKAVLKEQEANKKLVDHINKCNKEVIRLQGLVAMKESLRKEALLRSTIKKLQKK